MLMHQFLPGMDCSCCEKSIKSINSSREDTDHDVNVVYQNDCHYHENSIDYLRCDSGNDKDKLFKLWMSGISTRISASLAALPRAHLAADLNAII